MDWKSAIIGGLAIVGGATILMVVFGFVAKMAEERRRHEMVVKRLMNATMPPSELTIGGQSVDRADGRVKIN